jgi:hypothetical protein
MRNKTQLTLARTAAEGGAEAAHTHTHTHTHTHLLQLHGHGAQQLPPLALDERRLLRVDDSPDAA